MPALPPLSAFLVAVVLACAGWFLLFRAGSMAPGEHAVRKRSSSSAQASYAGLAAKPWFPLVLRCQGILCWLAALFLLGLTASTVIFQ
jgi:hypothetical protein